MALFAPDYIFDTIYDISPAFLKGIGISCIVCDIDNTLVTYDDPEPTPSVLEWFEKMKQGGITFAFVSNNEVTRAEIFNKPLGYRCYGKARKPFTGAINKAVKDFGVPKNEVAALGDQIFTDVCGAKFARLGASILVPPIKDKTNLFFRAKRILERPIVKRFVKKNPGAFHTSGTVWYPEKKK